ncbi:MAG: ribosome assembly cofactor RimP [Flavobacteriaceae bacterium]|nr:ribosome assembly cofactor RimP [Flavobacteriaceae bacterium]MBT4112789.1 ribosome assembly cofactor RimP [Flavobacteriaceae bacterium]MBT4614020.1 ribosome assembly cofactor RimP [Flavobacteriaceae bacterium]MBT5245937.1 ribosome assembly cofactor RimP [Flavobacteriaceae bacterium]MBT5650279.1 ribosome assembly cofactor RimP [Flavobacteriaceae bacterium]
MLRNITEKELANCLKNREDLFLIDLDIALDNSIKIIIDGDRGVSVDDCMYVSRFIEQSIDRDKHDFSLEVSSSGALTPLSSIRQYMKNIGRTLFVRTTNDTEYEAKLIDADSNQISLFWKQRERKLIGKGKITVEKKIDLLYKDIIEAKIKIKL